MKNLLFPLLLVSGFAFAAKAEPQAPAQAESKAVPHVLVFLSLNGDAALQEFSTKETCEKAAGKLTIAAYLKDLSPKVNECLPK